jgi:hypothetical protein
MKPGALPKSLFLYLCDLISKKIFRCYGDVLVTLSSYMLDQVVTRSRCEVSLPTSKRL